MQLGITSLREPKLIKGFKANGRRKTLGSNP
jgi:hypothetical protein